LGLVFPCLIQFLTCTDGAYFIQDVGECTITFEPLGGDGFYGDIAVDDISVKVKVATFPT